jgi:hypothetical protein
LGCPGEVSPVLGRLAEVFVYPCWSNEPYELFCVDLRSLNKEPTFYVLLLNKPSCRSITSPAAACRSLFSVSGYSGLRRLKIN